MREHMVVYAATHNQMLTHNIARKRTDTNVYYFPGLCTFCYLKQKMKCTVFMLLKRWQTLTVVHFDIYFHIITNNYKTVVYYASFVHLVKTELFQSIKKKKN